MTRPAPARPLAGRAWHALTAVNCGLALVIQLVLVIRGHTVLVEADGTTAGAPERVLRFFSYFTVQSNILAAVTAALLAIRPQRSGRGWDVVRFAAVLGMTTTIIVYVVALAPILDLHGIAWVTDVMFHYIGPVLTLGGWLLFGPWGRIDRGVVVAVICWPVAYFGYTQVLGAGTDWYPYPFLDAGKHGTAQVLLNALVVTALVLGLAAAFGALDRRLDRRPDRGTPDPTTPEEQVT